MNIENITRPNEDPIESDWIRITHDTGAIESKVFHAPPSISLPNAIASKTAEIYALAKRRLDQAWATYSQGEQYLWTALEADARIIATGGNVDSDSPLLAEAAVLGVSNMDYATTIIGKADALRALRAAVVAKRTLHLTAVSALIDVEAVSAYDATDILAL